MDGLKYYLRYQVGNVNVLLITCWGYQFVNIVAAQTQGLQAAKRFLIFIKILLINYKTKQKLCSFEIKFNREKISI